MISTELYDGQGLGNQLWAYAVTRMLADKAHTDFSIIGRERFKGQDFIELDFGAAGADVQHHYMERKDTLRGTDIDVSGTDKKLFRLKPNTKIDGGFQSTEYLRDYRHRILEWIKVDTTSLDANLKNIVLDENACIIHIRAGDFKDLKDVFLPREYYLRAMVYVRKVNPDVKFYCISDQPETAKAILPEVPVIGSAKMDKTDRHKAGHHHGGPVAIDFCLMMLAKYLIIPNSSFSWWATYLNQRKALVIAPKYWARHNVSDVYWSTWDIITDGFIYLDRNGSFFSAHECRKERDSYKLKINSSVSLLMHAGARRLARIFGRHKIDATSPPKKYDCFIFFDELDLLEIRLNMLDLSVDYFVLVEATKTFTGIAKPLYFEKNKKRFEKFLHKIIHIVVDDMPDSFEELGGRIEKAGTLDRFIINNCLNTPNVPRGAVHWLREFYQKEQIIKGLTNARHNDICYISDLDEIWNASIHLNFNPKKVYRTEQIVYAYYMNNRSSEYWLGTVVCSYGTLRKMGVNHVRTPSMNKFMLIKNGGWHFTFQGGAVAIRKKIESYGHQEYNTEEIKIRIENRINSEQDVMGRKFTFRTDESGLPAYILNNRDKYKKYFK